MEELLILGTLVNLLGLWVYWFICRRLYRLDEIRQRLFAIRDDAFLYCAENAIPFENRGHVYLRGSLNAMIRYTRRLNYATLFTLTLFPDTEARADYEDKVAEAETALPIEHRDAFRDFHQRMHAAITDYFIHNSIFSIVLWYALTTLATLLSLFVKSTRDKDPKAEVTRRTAPLVEADAVQREAARLAPAA